MTWRIACPLVGAWIRLVGMILAEETPSFFYLYMEIKKRKR